MKPSKGDCTGCTENFYNGNNPLGVRECWNFKTATLVKRVRVHINAVPPYRDYKPKTLMSCRREKGFVLVKPEAIKADGYWA